MKAARAFKNGGVAPNIVTTAQVAGGHTNIIMMTTDKETMIKAQVAAEIDRSVLYKLSIVISFRLRYN
jgi:hypothetical protein